MKSVLIIFLLLLAGLAVAENNVYWLRGDDYSTFINGEKANFMSTITPNISSKETTFISDNNILGKWYTSVFPQGTQLTGHIVFYSNSHTKDLEWSLSEFKQDNSEKLIFSGKLRKGELKQEEKLTEIYELKKGSRLLLKIISEGKIELDKSVLGEQFEWVSPNNETFTAPRLEKTGFLYLEQCTAEEIMCRNTLDCDDSNPFTQDICTNPNTCNSHCSYLECEPACVNGLSCIDENPLTIDLCSESGSCEATCRNIACQPECRSNSDCSNNEGYGLCMFAGTCAAECIHNVKLEEQGCRLIECSEGECTEREKKNCCGNGLCEAYENCENDCEGNKVEIISPKKGDYFPLGEEILIEARGSTKVSGFFGEKQLNDQGINGDKKLNDGIYSAKIIPAHAGEKTVTFHSDKPRFLNLQIAPHLEFFLKTDKDEYTITEEIKISGSVSRKSTPVAGKVLLNAKKGEKEIFSRELEIDRFGNFKLNYKSLSTQPPGEWIISAKTEDEFGNKGQNEKRIVFRSPEEDLALDIEIINEFKQEYSRGEKIIIEAIVKDNFGKKTDASLFATINNEKIQFKKNGIYTAQIVIPQKAETDVFAIKLFAEKGTLRGFLEKELLLKKEPLRLVVESPLSETFLRGETINYRFYFLNENNNKVTNIDAKLIINGEEKDLVSDNGNFTASFSIGKEERIESRIEGSIDGATASRTINIAVAGYSYNYYLSTFGPLIFAALIVILISGYFIMHKYNADTKREKLGKREKEITRQIKFVQVRYFKLGSLSRTKYDQLMNKYESELQSIREELKK